MMVTYPIAETFGSIQGEGFYTGTPMFFIRLAGCSVGQFKPTASVKDTALSNQRAFHIHHSICTSIDGQEFLCDTDYRMHEKLSLAELVERSGDYEHICITGGEPYNHDLTELAAVFKARIIHIETSGTVHIPPRAVGSWITCCPKKGFLVQHLSTGIVNEWKFLIGPGFDETTLLHFHKSDPYHRPIYLQPIGDVNSNLASNMALTLELLKKHPYLKLSAQLHKYLEVR